MFSQKRRKQKRVEKGTRHRCGLSWDSLAPWGVWEQETTTELVPPWDKWVGLLHPSVSHHWQLAAREGDSSLLSSHLVLLPYWPPVAQATMRYFICEVTEMEATKRWPPSMTFITGHDHGSSLPGVQRALTYASVPGWSVSFGNFLSLRSLGGVKSNCIINYSIILRVFLLPWLNSTGAGGKYNYLHFITFPEPFYHSL